MTRTNLNPGNLSYAMANHTVARNQGSREKKNDKQNTHKGIGGGYASEVSRGWHPGCPDLISV